MDLEIFKIHFLKAISDLDCDGLKFFIFGSMINATFFKDIDILIIYDDFENLNSVKNVLNKKLQIWLPHFTCLSKSEEIQLSFVKHTRAIEIIQN